MSSANMRPSDAEVVKLLRSAVRFIETHASTENRPAMRLERECRAAADALEASANAAKAEAIAKLCNCGAGFVKPMPHDAGCPLAAPASPEPSPSWDERVKRALREYHKAWEPSQADDGLLHAILCAAFPEHAPHPEGR